MIWRVVSSRGAEASVICRVAKVIASAVALAHVLSCAGEASAAEPHFAFGVISGTMHRAADEAATQQLLDSIGLEPNVAFIVYDGNLKSASERCDDAVYEERQQVLETSRVPVIVIPGRHDWADCDRPQEGSFDVAERLDFLRQTLFADSSSLGQSTLALTRESEVARFHAYRENVRWQVDDTVFVGLNVVSGNNHYSTAGGRNGEYDDRAIATAFWLEHAAEYARRRGAHALVVFIEAAPDFERFEHADRFSWLRFDRRLPRDGYLEFKRSLVKAAKTFRGPVIVIHNASKPLPHDFSIDQPLFDDKGDRLTNLTRIAMGPRDPTTQWVKVDVNFAKAPPFLVSLKQISISQPQRSPPPLSLPPAPQASPFGLAPSASGVTPAPSPIPFTAPASEPPLLPERREPAPNPPRLAPTIAPPDIHAPASTPSPGSSMQGGS